MPKKTIIGTYLALLTVNAITMLILNELDMIRLLIYNTIFTIIYYLYRTAQMWCEKTLIKLQALQQGKPSNEEQTSYMQRIQVEIDKAFKEDKK